MIKENTIAKVLKMGSGIKTSPEEMAKSVRLTVFPFKKNEESEEVISFYKQLRQEMEELGVSFVPFEESLHTISLSTIAKRFVWMLGNNISHLLKNLIKGQPEQPWMGYQAFANLLKRRRVKPGISVLSLGEHKEGELPMDYTSSFRRTSVITILEMPNHITEQSSFEDHFTTALELFSYHMTNIVIAVSKKKWLIYNFNASHPIFSRDEKFRENILTALIPKIHAPIKPPKLTNFSIQEGAFRAQDRKHKSLVKDMIAGGKLLGKTNLYPDGKLLEDLSFRNSFYQWIGRLHIDKRNGMSFGFLARQMPTQASSVQSAENFEISNEDKKRGYFLDGGSFHFLLNVNDNLYAIKFPSVWVLTQRSGSDKTNMHPIKDLVKLGLTQDGLHLHTPEGVKIQKGYRPSFDTRVILAHALGNSLATSLFDHFGVNDKFVKSFQDNGMALAHWHGYLHPEYTPDKIHTHGVHKPHVACSSPQSAIYALQGKMSKVIESIENNQEFKGDIHIEPHHGVNVNYYSLSELGEFLSKNTEASKLGNEYLDLNK